MKGSRGQHAVATYKQPNRTGSIERTHPTPPHPTAPHPTNERAHSNPTHSPHVLKRAVEQLVAAGARGLVGAGGGGYLGLGLCYCRRLVGLGGRFVGQLVAGCLGCGLGWLD